MSTMKEDKADAIDAAPTQIHHEVVPQGVMRSEAGEELVGAGREPYGPSGTSLSCTIFLLYSVKQVADNGCRF